MRIAILGYGLQGRAAYEYWQQGNEITICDADESTAVPKEAGKQLGPDYLKNLDKFDLIVRSPKIHPRDIVANNSTGVLEKVTTVTNEFLRVCPTTNVIGVTGTKGKGTTSTLITKMLEADGKTIHLGGNIGTPPLEMLKNNIQKDDYVVLELANFQLIDLKYSPHIAVCLMVVPEHLDWHKDMEEYITAKQQLFANQVAGDIAIYYAKNDISKQAASAGLGTKIPYCQMPGAEVADSKIIIEGQSICDVSELKLLGKHNWQNVCAAVTAVWQITKNTEAMRSVLTAFSGLEHRLEFVREVDGVRYYNDSFAVTPDSAVAAMNAIPGTKVAIMGGFDRQLPLENFAKGIASESGKIRKVLLIGASAERTAQAFSSIGFSNYTISKETFIANIVANATSYAKPGDSVVLSPGFPSFDMFKNFEERGLEFKKAVSDL